MLAKQLDEALQAEATEESLDITDIEKKFADRHNAVAKAMAGTIARISGLKVSADAGGWKSTITIGTPLGRSLYVGFGTQANFAKREVELVLTVESPLFGREMKDPKNEPVKRAFEKLGTVVYGLNMLRARYKGITEIDPYHNEVKYGATLTVPAEHAEETLTDLNKIGADIAAELGKALKGVAK